MYNHKKTKTDTCKNILNDGCIGDTYKRTCKVAASVKVILFINALVKKCPLQNKRKHQAVGKCYTSKSFLIVTYWHYIK